MDNDDNSGLPWIEKYRPDKLNEILSHDEIISTLDTFIKSKCVPHLLFYGPPGTGKTSAITAVAKELYGIYFPFMVMELNASDDRGIDIVKNKIKQFVVTKNSFYGKTTQDRKDIFKLVILDETDAMTSDAQAILRKIIEKYTNNTRFCLICNYIQNISPALQSRCTRFRFSPIDDENIKEKIITIANIENIQVDESGINTIIKRASGDMRKAINTLQSVSMSYPIIDEKNVNVCSGYPRKKHMDKIITSLLNDSYENTYDCIIHIKNKYGLSLNDIITEIHDMIILYIINPNDNQVHILNKLNIEITKNILDKLRTIEFNQSVNTIENIQISGLIGVFKLNI